MPFGDYENFADCVAKNGDKANPEAFCAWLEHKTTGHWPSEASKFNDAELKQFEADMDKAADKAGTNYQFQALKTRRIVGIEVFSEGTWTDSTGTVREWMDADLDKMVELFKAGKPELVALKVGHSSDKFNRRIAEALGVPVEVITGEGGKGQIALGQMKTLEHKNGKLIASFEGVPAALADLIEGGQFINVSSEIDDSEGGPVLEAVALLGAEEPAVENLKPLSMARVFQKGGKTLTHSGEVSTDELNREFSDIEEKVEQVIKSKRGARIFRTLWQELKKKFEIIAGTKGHSAPEHMQEVDDMKFQQDNEAWIKVVTELGLDSATATLEDVMAAIKALKEKAMPPETMEQKAQFSRMQSEVTALQARNKELEHAQRVVRFQRIAEGMKAITGKPADLAAKWADIEEKVGEEVANAIVAQYQAANEMSMPITKVIGRAKPQGESKDEFEKTVHEYAKAHNLSFEQALARQAMTNKAEFAAYHERMKKEQGG